MSRDRNGDSGSYAYWWSQHFEFFNKQEDKIEMYDTWKSLELRLRCEYRTQPTIHDANHYATQYELCKSEYRSEKRLKEMFSRNYRPTNNNNRDNDRNGFNGRSGRTNSYRPRNSPTSSFPPGNRRTTLPVCCILCGEKGHPVGQHDKGNVPTKGSDGKSIWGKNHQCNTMQPRWPRTLYQLQCPNVHRACQKMRTRPCLLLLRLKKSQRLLLVMPISTIFHRIIFSS